MNIIYAPVDPSTGIPTDYAGLDAQAAQEPQHTRSTLGAGCCPACGWSLSDERGCAECGGIEVGDDTVPEDAWCPNCSENAVDNLEWVDDEHVFCSTCLTIYRP